MPPILHLEKILNSPPEDAFAISREHSAGFTPRHYRDSADILPWLRLRTLAFAKERPGLAQWTERDFEREFLAKPWWSPTRMWLVEDFTPGGGAPVLVGAVCLAERGATTHDPLPGQSISGGGMIPDARSAPGGGDAVLPLSVIHWLMVHPGYRRRGLGEWLIHVLEQAVWDSGGRTIHLETHAGWSAAVRLYTRLGYSPVASTSGAG
ncbi:MAG: GNAT family N-acetyltransferase [Pirellulales bacterium]|nr:GNAT family N-acetyltransferase [Pirellulales bacterium]